MIRSVVAISEEKDSYVAGKEAAEEAVGVLGESPDLILVFASSFHDQKKVVSGVGEFAKKALVVGCSSAGEVVGIEERVYSGSVAVMALQMEGVKLKSFKSTGAKKSSYDAGKKLAEKIKEKPSLLLLFAEGLAENGADIVRGVQDILGEDLPIVGGLAGDDFEFKKTHQYFDGKVFSDSLVGIAFYGEFSFGLGADHGWEPVTLPLIATKTERSTIKEIDNKPALALYEDYFGRYSEELARGVLAKTIYTYPLGIENKKGFLLRELLKANKKGEVDLMADIPQGSSIRLMIGYRSKVILAAEKAAKRATEKIRPRAVIMFNCIGRKKLLGLDCKTEIDRVRKIIGKETPLIGFYTYGEIGPFQKKGDKSVFHNETMNILVLGD